MFHFTLVHVPRSHYTPNRLSRRQPQPGDEEEPEDNFGDWIDNVNGFLHFINPHPSYIKFITHTPPITSYIHSYFNTAVEEQLEQQKEEEPNNSLRRFSSCIRLQVRRSQEMARNPQETSELIKCKIQILYVN